MRDRSTNKRATGSGIKTEKNWAKNGALGNSAGKRDGEMCGGMATADVRNDRYEVNHGSEREEMSNDVDRR